MRALAALVVAAALMAPAAADAAPKPTNCTRLLEDPAGDVDPVAAAQLPQGHVDLRSGGVLFSRDHLYVLIGVADLREDWDGYWRIHLSIGGTRYYATATRDTFWGTLFTMDGLKGVTGVFDDVRQEIRLQVPLRSFGKKPPQKGRTPVSVDWMGADVHVPDPTWPWGGPWVFKDEASGYNRPARTC
jgi:hypothetical protein